MKTLVLVRHAKSSWADGAQDDHDRPLNERGLRDAPRMAKRLAARPPHPDAIVSSTARRARDTAAAFAAALGAGPAAFRLEAALYHAAPQEALALIAGFPDSWESAVCVGHNPGLTALAAGVFGAPVEHMPTGSVVRLWFDTRCWSQVPHSRPLRGDFDWPKNESTDPRPWP